MFFDMNDMEDLEMLESENELQDEMEEQVQQQNNEVQFVEIPKLPMDIRKILGEPAEEETRIMVLHPELGETWEMYTKLGIKAEKCEELKQKYPTVGSCQLAAPLLNTELKGLLNPNVVLRDDHFADLQNLVGVSMSALGAVISPILEGKEWNEMQSLENLCDVGKLLAHTFCELTKTRKSFLNPNIKNEVLKNTVETAKAGVYLYGDNLTEKFREHKALTKITAEFKENVSENSGHLNYQRPFQGMGRKPAVQRRQFFKNQNYTPNQGRQGPKPYQNYRQRNTGQYFPGAKPYQRPYQNQKYNQEN